MISFSGVSFLGLYAFCVKSQRHFESLLVSVGMDFRPHMVKCRAIFVCRRSCCFELIQLHAFREEMGSRVLTVLEPRGGQVNNPVAGSQWHFWVRYIGASFSDCVVKLFKCVSTMKYQLHPLTYLEIVRNLQIPLNTLVGPLQQGFVGLIERKQ